MRERTIEVSDHFYAELSQYLLAEERWIGQGPEEDMRHGIVLFSLDGMDWSQKKLVFVRQRRGD